MKNTNGDGVKYIDGIYRQPIKKSRPIQVELPLEDVTSVPVSWQTSKPTSVEKTLPEDKFYSLATAAFSGVKPRQKMHLRLRRRNSNEITIAQATKRAKELEKVTPIKQSDSPSLSLFMAEDNQSKKKRVKTRVVFINKMKKLYVRVETLLRQVSARYFKPSLQSLVLIQAVIIIILGAGLVTSLYSYGQYKQKTTTALRNERQQSDAQWQELKASWECISNKWERIQANPAITNQVQGEVTC